MPYIFGGGSAAVDWQSDGPKRSVVEKSDFRCRSVTITEQEGDPGPLPDSERWGLTASAGEKRPKTESTTTEVREGLERGGPQL